MLWQVRPGFVLSRGALDGQAVAAPGNTVLPVISGTPTVGSTLTTTNGTWTGTGITYSYQWKRGGTNIGGATSSSYVLVTADIGTTITAVVTATNAGGSTSATSAGVSISAPSNQMLSAARAGLGMVVVTAASGKAQAISNVGVVNG